MQMGQMRIGDDGEGSMMMVRRSGSDVVQGNEDGDDERCMMMLMMRGVNSCVVESKWESDRR